jgi:hypothetical protein
MKSSNRDEYPQSNKIEGLPQLSLTACRWCRKGWLQSRRLCNSRPTSLIRENPEVKESDTKIPSMVATMQKTTTQKPVTRMRLQDKRGHIICLLACICPLTGDTDQNTHADRLRFKQEKRHVVSVLYYQSIPRHRHAQHVKLPKNPKLKNISR